MMHNKNFLSIPSGPALGKVEEVANKTNAWFAWTIAYLIVDFARPQGLLHLEALRPGMATILVLAGYCLSRGCFYFNVPTIRILWFFLFLLTVHVPFAHNNFWAYKTAESFLLFFPFILSILYCVVTLRRLILLVDIIISTMAYMSIWGLLHGGRGGGGYFTDENDLALFVVFVMPFCYFLLFSGAKKTKKVFYLATLLIGLAAIVATRSRGGIVGLCVITIGIWLFSKRKVVSLVLIGVLAAFMVFLGDAKYWQEMATAADPNESTASARLESWVSGWRMFLDNPLGVGGNNFLVRFPEYQTEWFKRGMWGRVAHSIWFTLIPELGIPGIILYLSLTIKNFKNIFLLQRLPIDEKSPDSYLKALPPAFICSILGYFACGTFLSVLYYPYYWYLTAIIVIAVRLGQEAVEHKGSSAILKPVTRIVAGGEAV